MVNIVGRGYPTYTPPLPPPPIPLFLDFFQSPTPISPHLPGFYCLVSLNDWVVERYVMCYFT